MIPYNIATPPVNPQHLPAYLQRELSRLSALLRQVPATIPLQELHVEPVKKDGIFLVFADGTDWNPGSGRGLYYYDSGWTFIG